MNKDSLWQTAAHNSPSSGRRIWQERQRRKNLYRLAAVAALVIFILAAAGIFAFQQIKPVVPLEFAGNTINVRRGADLQIALNQARPGDTIILEAGAEFVGSFEMPNKTGAEYITIQSSKLDKLPPENERAAPKDAVSMPKIFSSGKGAAAIFTGAAAHHYRFVGIEFAVANDDYVYNLIALGTDDQTAEAMPRFFEFDRCYIHSRGLNKTRRGFALNSADTVIKNCFVAGFAGAQDETQAIAGWNGAGRYQIINNYLEGATENILFGGADPSIPNLVPSDIEIRGNLLSKPSEWRGKVSLKFTLELKNARRVTISDNIIENCWDCGLLGLTVRNQSGTAPWSTIEDVEITNNLMRRASSAINLLGVDNMHKSQRLKNVKINNNLIEDVDSAKWGNNSGGGFFLQITNTENVEVAYNTAVKFNGNTITAYGAPNDRFSFHHNIVSYNDYGFWHETENLWAKNSIFGNVVVNSKGLTAADVAVPERNFAVQNFQPLGFASLKDSDYRLTLASRFKGKGENGKDPGCDIVKLNAAIAAAQNKP